MKLFPSTLVISPSITEITDLLNSIDHQIINNPDLLEISEYKIDVVRQITKFLAQKPLIHPNKVVLIQNADNLNLESQNALLKNLEEPGENNYFILTSSHPHSLLPTIISRCHHINYHFAAKISGDTLIIPDNIQQKLELTERLASDRLTTIDFLENQLRLYHAKLVSEPSIYHQQMIKKIIKSIALIKANIDPKTALDFLLLS
jgi:DNA polymerase III delta prime subunit